MQSNPRPKREKGKATLADAREELGRWLIGEYTGFSRKPATARLDNDCVILNTDFCFHPWVNNLILHGQRAQRQLQADWFDPAEALTPYLHDGAFAWVPMDAIRWAAAEIDLLLRKGGAVRIRGTSPQEVAYLHAIGQDTDRMREVERQDQAANKEERKRCGICGRFMRYNGPFAHPKWQCPKIDTDVEGVTEHW